MQEFIITTPSQLQHYFNDLEDKLRLLIQESRRKETPLKEYLTAKEATVLLNISNTTLHKWSNTGILTKHKIGRTVRFKTSEVNDALIRLESKKKSF